MIFKKTILIFLLGCVSLSAQNDDSVQQLKEYVKNGQLVYFTKSTPLMNGSEITYVNFCSDGTYKLSYDGSMMVKGTYGTSSENNRVYGASAKNTAGTWNIVRNMGMFYLEATTQMGEVSYYPINPQHLTNGKWVVGRTTYVFAQNKAECY